MCLGDVRTAGGWGESRDMTWHEREKSRYQSSLVFFALRWMMHYIWYMHFTMHFHANVRHGLMGRFPRVLWRCLFYRHGLRASLLWFAGVASVQNCKRFSTICLSSPSFHVSESIWIYLMRFFLAEVTIRAHWGKNRRNAELKFSLSFAGRPGWG